MSAFTARIAVPVPKRTGLFTAGFVAVAFVAGWAGGLQSHDRVISQTRTHKVTVQEQLGKPTSTVAGEQINAQLQGFVCEVWQAKAVILCHR